MELDAIGFKSPWAFLYSILFLVAPLVYVYIALMLLRDLCEYFPLTVQEPLQEYLPWLATIARLMKSYYGFRLVDVWCVVEALFYVACKLKIRYLQSRDPLESSLSAAPMLDSEERKLLWDRMMAADSDITWVTGWFLDNPDSIEDISRYEIFDFICWALFDGRNQEHLTTQELQDLESFIEDMEYRISVTLYGVVDDEDKDGFSVGPLELVEEDSKEDATEEGGQSGVVNAEDSHKQNDGLKSKTGDVGNEETINDDNDGDDSTLPRRPRSSSSNLSTISHSNRTDSDQNIGYGYDDSGYSTPKRTSRRSYIISEDDSTLGSGSAADNWGSSVASTKRPCPKKLFRFREDIQREEPNFFSNVYEAYKIRYDKYKTMVENAEIHPVQELRNLMAEAAQRAAKTAQSAEQFSVNTATAAYETIVQPGSNMDKQISALSHATSAQLAETANFLSEQRKALMQQLRGNRAMLTRMREMSYAVPTKQMAGLMRRITECYDALERTEVRTRDAILDATGRLADNAHFSQPQQEPKRFARYNTDPLMGIATYPLGFHALILGATEIPLRIMLNRRGFTRSFVGPVAYWHHPGRDSDTSVDDSGPSNGVFGLPPRNAPKKLPIVFVHGIGVGLISYVPLIDLLLLEGRPIIMPEIPYVSGFRPWQNPHSVLSPAVVASTMTAILAYHGYNKGTFVGHSYGTSWLSYVCKYSPNIVAALLFLDPICFCLHLPRLTTSFVYHRPDPGTVSFMIRTDMMVSWTIQRAFPWTWIAIFLDQIHVPCTIFLSDKDALVPAVKVEAYLRSNNVPISDATDVGKSFFDTSGDVNAVVFRDGYHGVFTEDPELVPPIALACSSLCQKVEKRDSR